MKIKGFEGITTEVNTIVYCPKWVLMQIRGFYRFCDKISSDYAFRGLGVRFLKN